MASKYLRGKTYWVKYYKNGQVFQESLRTRDKKVAEYLLRKKENEIEEGKIDRVKDCPSDLFLEEYISHFKNHVRHSTYDRDKIYLKAFFKWTKADRLSKITPDLIQEFIDHKRTIDQVSKKTANRSLEVLRAAFKYAVQKKYVRQNPADEVKKFRISYGPARSLEEKEITALLKAAAALDNPGLKTAIALAIYAGLRPQEFLNLDWEDINFANKTLVIRQKPGFVPKDFETRVIPLSDKLISILGDSDGQGRVLGRFKSARSVRRCLNELQEAVKIAELKDVDWLSLRRTFGSQLARKNVSLAKIQKWMGHSTPQTTMRHYAHLLPHYDSDIEKI